jgi:N-methylhydantoinase A
MRYGIDMRYVGQMNEVPLAWPSGRLAVADIPELRSAFEALYQQRYGAGTFRRETPLEIISFRAEAVQATDKPGFAPLFEGRRGSSAPKGRRQVYMRGRGPIDAAIYAYDDLVPGKPLAGPAVIERESTTVWLPPRACATLDVYGNLAIDLQT